MTNENGYEDPFYVEYAKYLAEDRVRKVHDPVLKAVKLHPALHRVIDLGCGKGNEFFHNGGKPEFYIGVDEKADERNEPDRITKKLDYRDTDAVKSLIDQHGLTGIVSLYSAQIMKSNAENDAFYKKLFKDNPKINAIYAPGFYYKHLKGQETTEELGGTLTSVQTPGEISLPYTGTFTETRVEIPCPSSLFGGVTDPERMPIEVHRLLQRPGHYDEASADALMALAPKGYNAKTCRVFTLDEANVEMRKLATNGVKVYDLRGKSKDEQAKLVQAIKSDIKTLLKAKDLAEDFPLTFVAGSGKTTDPAVLAEARAMGAAKEAILNGGSQNSVMGETAGAAKVKIGVTCDLVLPFEMPDARYNMIIIADGEGFKGLDNRLDLMRELAPKEVAIHGGMGTLEETLAGLKTKGRELNWLMPYWSPMIDTFKKAYAFGYIGPQMLDRMHPVDQAGKQLEKLSASVSLAQHSEELRGDISRIATTAKIILQRQQGGKGYLLQGYFPKENIVADGDFFIVPPSNTEALHQAVWIMCQKRIDMKFGDKAPNPGIAKKPLLLLNIDGFYDGFMQQWRQMEKGGFLTEKLSDLITEVQLRSDAKEAEIREKLAFIAPKKPAPMSEMIGRDQSSRIAK